MSAPPSYNDATAIDSPSPQQPQTSWDSISMGQQTEALVFPSNLNGDAADSTFNLEDSPGPNAVVQNLPANVLGQNPDVGAATAPLFANINIPELTALEPEGDIVGV